MRASKRCYLALYVIRHVPIMFEKRTCLRPTEQIQSVHFQIRRSFPQDAENRTAGQTRSLSKRIGHSARIPVTSYVCAAVLVISISLTPNSVHIDASYCGRLILAQIRRKPRLPEVSILKSIYAAEVFIRRSTFVMGQACPVGKSIKYVCQNTYL